MGVLLAEREVESARRPIATQWIVCGDCAGDGQLPRATLLTPQGACSGCGGRSYILVSKINSEGVTAYEP